MEHSTLIVSLVSASFGFILGLITLWIKKSQNKEALSKIDGGKVKRAIFKDKFSETVFEMEDKEAEFKKKYEKLKKKLEKVEKERKSTDNLVNELDNLVDELKEIAHKYASLYFGDNNLLAEMSEIWKDKKKTLEDYYFGLMKEYEKFSCSNCWKEYKLFWEINEKKMEEKMTKKSKGCRRCPNAIKTQDSNQDWNEEKEKIKEYFHLDLSDKIFNDLCRNCFFLLINTITAVQNSKTASKEFFERLGQIGRWEIDTKNQIIKVWERDEIWKIGLKNQNLNNVLKYMNF